MVCAIARTVNTILWYIKHTLMLITHLNNTRSIYTCIFFYSILYLFVNSYLSTLTSHLLRAVLGRLILHSQTYVQTSSTNTGYGCASRCHHLGCYGLERGELSHSSRVFVITNRRQSRLLQGHDSMNKHNVHTRTHI